MSHIDRWTFMGAGNMATSLVGGLLGRQPGAQISMIDPNPQACQRASDRFTVATASKLHPLAPEEALVIAVKPDKVREVCLRVREISGHSPGPLVISVAAGVRASAMQTWLPARTPIVRCMPNTPALLGLGASALFASEAANDTHRAAAQALLEASGLVVWVGDEPQLDAVTAVSGSGPAYVFRVVEAMAEAGERLGLDRRSALDLSIETLYGAASMVRAREDAPGVLREKVTSKGGTTAAALQVFEQGDLPGLFLRAMQAAKTRAEELGDLFGPDSHASSGPP